MEIFFGDIHGHASVSPCYWKDCPRCDPHAYYDYARQVSHLDFASLTEHDRALDEPSWAQVQEATKAFNVPGKFVSFLGYEWTNIRYGHQNVYFQDDEGPLIQSRESTGWVTPSGLWSALAPYQGRVMTVPHHVAVTQFPIDWTFYHKDYQPLTEVTSLWGDFVRFGQGASTLISNVLPSRYVQEPLENGYRLGFLGGGDSHDCRPGQPTFGGRHKPNVAPGQNLGHNPLAPAPVDVLSDVTCNFRGLTAVYATELTRDALWKALWARHTYATTGARILLHVAMGDGVMGDFLKGPDGILTIDVTGTALIDDISVYVNNDLVWHAEPESDRGHYTVNLSLHKIHDGFCYVYIHQQDGHRAWSSPIWWEGLTTPARYSSDKDFDSLLLRWDARPVRQEKIPHRIPSLVVSANLKRVQNARFILSLAFPTQQARHAISGSIAFNSSCHYRVREQGFKTTKYGGDLWTPQNASLRFHFPFNAERNENTVIELLFQMTDNSCDRMDVEVEGIHDIEGIDFQGQHVVGNPVSIHFERSKMSQTSPDNRCIRHELLVWPQD